MQLAKNEPNTLRLRHVGSGALPKLSGVNVESGLSAHNIGWRLFLLSLSFDTSDSIYALCMHAVSSRSDLGAKHTFIQSHSSLFDTCYQGVVGVWLSQRDCITRIGWCHMILAQRRSSQLTNLDPATVAILPSSSF